MQGIKPNTSWSKMLFFYHYSTLMFVTNGLVTACSVADLSSGLLTVPRRRRRQGRGRWQPAAQVPLRARMSARPQPRNRPLLRRRWWCSRRIRHPIALRLVHGHPARTHLDPTVGSSTVRGDWGRGSIT